MAKWKLHQKLDRMLSGSDMFGSYRIMLDHSGSPELPDRFCQPDAPCHTGHQSHRAVLALQGTWRERDHD